MEVLFVLFTGKDYQFRFNVVEETEKLNEFKVLLNSESYKTEAGRLTGIESVKENSQKDKQYKRLIARGGSHYFNLKGGNGEIIGTGMMRATLDKMEADIKSIKQEIKS